MMTPRSLSLLCRGVLASLLLCPLLAAAADTTITAKGTITANPCTVKDVPVSLDTVTVNDFKGQGSTVLGKDFHLVLTNCPAGLPQLSVRLDPTTSLIGPPTDGTVAFDTASTVRGVALQLNFSKSRGLVPLQQLFAINEYDPSKGGTVDLPLTASYRQTDATVGGGSANTALTFTLSYQ